MAANAKLGAIFDPMRNRGVPVIPFIYIGFIKANNDVQRMGRLSIWIPEMGGDPADPGSWITASYASPFAGASDIATLSGYTTNTKTVSQQSYGWWAVPPDLNNEVAVFFANGDISRAYWFACAYQQNMNKMVPGIAVDVTTGPSPPIPISPVIEYNKSDSAISADAPLRPPFAPLTAGLQTEGLVKDEERGSASTSARREAPSQVFGVLSPRGNTMHIDDSPQNEFVRIRTRSGTQVIVDETTGFVYINSKLGNSWLEVSDAGVDVYTSNSISMRAQQDVNIRADRNIVMDAGANIFMRAAQGITVNAGANINVGAAGTFNMTITGNTNIHTNATLNMKADGSLHVQSGSDTSLKSGGRQLRDGSTILDNSGASPDADATDASVPQGKNINDTTQTFSKGGSGDTNWTAGGGTVNTIVGRMPTHEPWPGHPNSKVPPPPTTTGIPNTSGNNGPANSQLDSQGCSFGANGTKPISTSTYNAITNASSQTGAPMATMLAIADQESSFNPSAAAGSSSASGLFQFTSSTYSSMVSQYGNKYNVAPGSATDANSNALMGGQYIQDNTKTLQNAGIANPTPGQVYMLHFLGNSGGVSFINQAQSNPNAPAASAFPAAAAANRSIFYNSDGSSKTMGQVYNNLTGSIDSKATAYANQYGLPAPCARGNGTNGATPSSPAASTNTNAGAYANDTGKVYGSGQCVALVQQVGGLPTTPNWQQGQNVQQALQAGNPPPIGTSIATFGANGTYTNSLDGTSHAAIITGYQQDSGGNYTGVTVLDQFSGSASRIHTIPFNNPGGKNLIANGSNYSVINVANKSS